MLLAITLCMSLIMPMSGTIVYADNEGKSVASEENRETADGEKNKETVAEEKNKETADGEKSKTAAPESKKTAKAVSAVTSITGYKTSYNKRYSQALKIEADITHVGSRDVQLQRYNSEEDTWTTILTAHKDVSDAPAAVAEQAERSGADETAGTKQDESSSADEAADTKQDESSSADEAAGTKQDESSTAEDTAATEQTKSSSTDASADTEQAESSSTDASADTEQAESSSTDVSADTEQAESPATDIDEDADDTDAVLSTEPATMTEENGIAHVTFIVPKEERQKTTSIWRIYVPAAKKVPAVSSDRITVITRNLEDLSISARTACIYRIDGDGQGTMIYSRKASTEVAQASTTKLMTAIVLLESGLIDSTTKVSAHAASTPYAAGRMTVGDVFSTRDLLYAMLLPSANDAATAVAERVGGSEEAFVNMMNAKAGELGLTKTHFRNPHGLDADGHYTTAKELAELTAYAYTFPEIRDCWATKYKVIKSLEKGRRWYLVSTNAIFGYVSNFLGGKTGTEGNARCCFTGVYTFNGGTYVTVVLGSGYGFSRWSDTKKLHKYIQDYALSRY